MEFQERYFCLSPRHLVCHSEIILKHNQRLSVGNFMATSFPFKKSAFHYLKKQSSGQENLM